MGVTVDNQLFIPDSNIFSELVKPLPNAQVTANYIACLGHIGLASTVWHELCYGLSIMPIGKRRELVAGFLTEQVEVLPVYVYDKNCADIQAKIRATAKQNGRQLPFTDSQIAAIAMANNATLVTRNEKDFATIEGLTVINWFV